MHACMPFSLRASLFRRCTYLLSLSLSLSHTHTHTHTHVTHHQIIMGRSACCDNGKLQEGAQLKKGPWAHEEDEKLRAFVKEHGHGNWRSLPKKCGLLRCGKSCRLRWTNYLRPDIKRGRFTQSDEQKIIQLHALVGNKWAFIASQLPRRTDNEIKNYWNTVLKKRIEKVGLLSASRAGSTLKSIKKSASKCGNNNISDGGQGNMVCSPSAVMSCSHLAQWESARLEAEARVAKESHATKTHKLLSFVYMGHSFPYSATTTTSTTSTSAFSSLPTSTTSTIAFSNSFPSSSTTCTSAFSSLPHSMHTTPQSLAKLSNCLFNTFIPSSISNPSPIHHPSTSSLSLQPHSHPSSSLSLLANLVSSPASCSASNNSSSTSNMFASSESMSRLSSQESMASSALTLGPSGRLSWQAKEISFTIGSPSPKRDTYTSNMLCKDHGHEVLELQGSTKGDLTSTMESSMMDLNSTMESSMDLNNWHELLFEVESSCSDVVSTSWKDPIMASPEREEFTHNTTKPSTLECTLDIVQDHAGSLDLEGLHLLHFDSLMSCEQHSKELVWDTSTTLSIS